MTSMKKLHLNLHTLADVVCAGNMYKEKSIVHIKDIGLIFHTVPLLFSTFIRNKQSL